MMQDIGPSEAPCTLSAAHPRDYISSSATIMSEDLQRPKFSPRHISTECLRNADDGLTNWLPVVNCSAGFPPDIVSINPSSMFIFLIVLVKLSLN
jgi:hypothetical protein